MSSSSGLVQFTDPLPVEWPVDRVVPPRRKPLPDAQDAVEAALARPISSLPLSELCGPRSRVTVVCAIGAHGRDHANAMLLPLVLRQLEKAGVRESDVTILVATSGRAPINEQDKRQGLGEAILSRYRVVVHDAQDREQLDDLGTFEGVPLQVNYRAVEADLLIAVDVVEPHYFAGFSGGNKTIAIGCAGESTVREIYAPRILEDAAAHANGSRNSLMQTLFREIARRTGLMFIVNVVMDQRGEIAAAGAGAPTATHEALVEAARDIYEIGVPRDDYNIVVADGHASRRHTLYQASQAAVRIGLSEDPVLVKGGVLILPARCEDTDEESSNERNFYEALSNATDMDTVIHQLGERGLRPGEQRAYMLAQTVVAQKYRVIVVGEDCAGLARSCGMISAHDMLEAASLAETLIGRRPRVLIMPPGNRLTPVYNRRAQLEEDDIYMRLPN
jgi:lactate racemase